MVVTLGNRLIKECNHSEEDALKKVIHFDIQKTDELIKGKWETDSLSSYFTTNHEAINQKVLRGLIGKQRVNLIAPMSSVFNCRKSPRLKFNER